MFIDGENGQAHFICYRLYRPIVDPTKHERAPALWGKRLKDALKVAQLVTRFDPGLRAVVER